MIASAKVGRLCLIDCAVGTVASIGVALARVRVYMLYSTCVDGGMSRWVKHSTFVVPARRVEG